MQKPIRFHKLCYREFPIYYFRKRLATEVLLINCLTLGYSDRARLGPCKGLFWMDMVLKI